MIKKSTILFFLFTLYSHNAMCSELEIDAFFVTTENLPVKNINKLQSLPNFNKLTSVNINKLIHVVFIAKGYGVDNSGKTNLELDLKIISPSNKILFAQEKFSVMKIIRQKEMFVVFDPMLDFMIESGDELGKYSVSTRVIDSASKDAKVKNISINVQQ